ncbi:hypothetical protein F2Q69_00005978 [Brassica cretica]|uniref:CCHC-type domain-containing protein n=1 Tax=Brassica cretica TaxID=69181 RepID=A0A8S9NTH4_BRACR|nr:hypothetical protein F2Q69_00005978 [Brassica cretica]
MTDNFQGDRLYVSQERGRQQGMQQNGSSMKRSKSKFGKKVVCYRCGKPGTIEETVPKRGSHGFLDIGYLCFIPHDP